MKMGESIASRNPLEISISFGKFENDSLSWEKWSSFSPNKYLEEVGILSTPGSVAQKKAYFEAHYKQIAAQKDALLELQKPIEPNPSISDINQNIADHTECSSGSVFSGQGTGKEVEIDHSPSNETDVSGVDELKEESSAAKYETSIEEANEIMNGEVDSHGIDDQEEISLINDEAHLMESRIEEDLKERNLKLDTRNLSQKVTSKKKENLSETKKKKLVPMISKLANASTKKLPEPKIKTTPIAQSRSMAEKSSGSSVSRSKNTKSMETKRVARTTLHMSLNLDPSNSSDPPPSVGTHRRSLFMEKMGDKDIVKRAFKTFRHGLNQSRTSTDECSLGVKEIIPIRHVPKEEIKQKVSTSTTLRKDNERNTGEKMNTQRGRVGTTWKSVSSGSLKEAGLDGRKLNASSFLIGSRSDERAEKRKEFFNKVEEKSYAKEMSKTRLNSRLTVEKETDNNKLKQNLNFNAKPVPDFYRGLKSSTERVGMKTGIMSRPQVA